MQAIQINPDRMKNKDPVCTNEEKEMHRSLVSQLGWLSTKSRPDLSFDVLELSCKTNNLKIGDIFKANKCLRKACMFLKAVCIFPNLMT